MLVVGPSGAGKDTLLDGAREALRQEPGFCFARRAITRPASAGGEDHRSLSEAEFDAAEAQGAFCLSWRAHGLAYGIPSSCLDEIAAGAVVIANVSRGVIRQAENLAARVMVINITAPADLLARRLAARGRESEQAILLRLSREAALDTGTAQLVTISNDATIAQGTAQLVAALTGLCGPAHRA